MTRPLQADPAGGLTARLARDEAKLVELGSDYDDGLISRSEYLARRDRLAIRSEQTQSTLQGRSRWAALAGFTEPGGFGEPSGRSRRESGNVRWWRRWSIRSPSGPRSAEVAPSTLPACTYVGTPERGFWAAARPNRPAPDSARTPAAAVAVSERALLIAAL